MNEAEKRRMDLLVQTRNLYHDKTVTPIVHPRYGSAYQHLYESVPTYNNEEKKGKREGTLKLRILLSLVIFALYASADYNDMAIGSYTSEEVLQVISYDFEY